MTDAVRSSQGELTASEVLAVLEEGGRVIIELGVLDGSMQATIREKDGTYYCDTTTKLLTHDSPEELRACLENHQLVDPETPGRTSPPA